MQFVIKSELRKRPYFMVLGALFSIMILLGIGVKIYEVYMSLTISSDKLGLLRKVGRSSNFSRTTSTPFGS
jgi:hypothetical protein